MADKVSAPQFFVRDWNHMLKIGAIAVLSLFAVMPSRSEAAVPSGCQIENASYKLQRDPTIVARFVKIPKAGGLHSDLAFEVVWNKDRTAYWYTFDRGTDPYLNMVSIFDPTAPDYVPPSIYEEVKRPHGDMQYLALQKDLRFDDRLPVAGMKAPDLILMPRLPEIRLRFSPSYHAFFELTGCTKSK
jgi:hypothetical protein